MKLLAVLGCISIARLRDGWEGSSNLIQEATFVKKKFGHDKMALISLLYSPLEAQDTLGVQPAQDIPMDSKKCPRLALCTMSPFNA